MGNVSPLILRRDWGGGGGGREVSDPQYSCTSASTPGNQVIQRALKQPFRCERKRHTHSNTFCKSHVNN